MPLDKGFQGIFAGLDFTFPLFYMHDNPIIKGLLAKIEKLGPSDLDRKTLTHIESTYDKPGDLIGAYGRLVSRMMQERRTTVRADIQPVKEASHEN